jgi:hypothetical protein
MTPFPGKPRRLGPSEDLVDARAVLDVARACGSTLDPRRPGADPGRVLREALWFIWERPRLPGPLVAGKYPKPYPWSAEARARFIKHQGTRPAGGWGLVLEHVYPRELLVRHLLHEATDVADEEAADLLGARLMATVVTRDEDRRLPTRSQSARPWPEYITDPWLRYRMAHFDIDGFIPLSED